MLKVITPATTSNLGVGFDCLGMALNIKNIFAFNLTHDFDVYGFEEKYLDNNLVKEVYLDCCQKFGVGKRKMARISIALSEGNIPIARGLGSSASCIVAGAIAASHFNNLNLSKEEIAKYCANYEGHPDNVYACIFGGLVSIIKDKKDYYFDNLRVSKDLKFSIRIPSIEGNTEKLRNALPEKIKLSDAVFNLSRILHFPKALEMGEMSLVKKFSEDKYHEKYRAKYIPNYKEVKKTALENGIVPLISGSGPSMFFISDKNNFRVLMEDCLEGDILAEVKIANGVSWKVI